MRRCLLLVFCAAGIFAVQSHNISFNETAANRPRIGRQNNGIKRYACPIGFFRLKRYCYYLSGGTAPWREAYFHCKDRNATLAILDRNGKDRMLRKYLWNDQFTKLERWIGGIYNWQQMAWEWGMTGEKVHFQNFGQPEFNRSKQYAWHCITIDPRLKYKWSPQSCVERKHYVCEVLAGRIVGRRKKTADSRALQNQKSRKKGKKYLNESHKSNGRNKRRNAWRKKNYVEQNADDWAHGVNLGSRPPSYNEKIYYSNPGMRHHSNRTRAIKAQNLFREKEYNGFLADGSNNGPQSLMDMNRIFPQISGINNLASEEVLKSS
ncbi:uncharacterized protein LOC105736564 isoform X1 [Apis florea]|uniref:uncharacterized protein LOC105736564 isoform X1 n=1 Tax=Apis florea TaxID=7463 RepID=UPI000629BB06|nr:uncharacterized protein LOC105736564 isoform X1 [Apis florea]XP_012347148.1 uncharacterized protein LOC105736564 isoform X1 [Apis florea]